MKIEVKDKNERAIPNGQYVLEALGFKELYEKLYGIEGWQDEMLVKALVMFEKDHPQHIDDETWRVYLADNIVLYLKKNTNGQWYAEVVLPIIYRDDLVFFLSRMEKILQRVKEVERAIDSLEGEIGALSNTLNKLIEEKEGMKKKNTTERLANALADFLEKFVAHLDEIEE
ncbi:MAG: hypothetical protein JHC26_08785 [Thermofilum sp.]|jgi:hypothetical protein|uniref:hypothetical protein n=1 Tax=Thermofilum sp. TaxID=1961369 RepID=UPI002585EA70|nr:hypothetical protein [Thermofilum sp.]MCI4409173.1 hypothetical protein [Thermofilum sp.]